MATHNFKQSQKLTLIYLVVVSIALSMTSGCSTVDDVSENHSALPASLSASVRSDEEITLSTIDIVSADEFFILGCEPAPRKQWCKTSWQPIYEMHIANEEAEQRSFTIVVQTRKGLRKFISPKIDPHSLSLVSITLERGLEVKSISLIRALDAGEKNPYPCRLGIFCPKRSWLAVKSDGPQMCCARPKSEVPAGRFW